MKSKSSLASAESTSDQAVPQTNNRNPSTVRSNESQAPANAALDRQASSGSQMSIVELDDPKENEKPENPSIKSLGELKREPLSSSKLAGKRGLEFSTSIGHLSDDNYVHIQNDTTFQLNDEEVSVSVVLNYCKNCVFKPYFRLVSIVGLRPLFGPTTLFRLSRLPLIGCFLRSINILYTLFVLLIILSGYILQATSCYRQDGLPTFVRSSTLPKHKEHASHPEPFNELNEVDRQQGSTTKVPRNLAIDFEQFNGTINRYDLLNEQANSAARKSNEPLHIGKRSSGMAISSLDEASVKNNYEAYKDIYEVRLKNGHIWLHKPAWLEQLLNMTRYRKGQQKPNGKHGDDVETKDYLNPEDSNSLVCSGNLFTMFLLPDLLHLSAYLITIYLMRTSGIEKTEHLLEKSFLQASQTSGWLIANRRLVQKLRFFLYLAFSWLLVSVMNHLLHLSFQTVKFAILDQLALTYHAPWLQAKLQKPLLIFTVITLIFQNLICSVIIVLFAIHCELNISFIQNLCLSLREKKCELQEFIKGIEEARKFVKHLNNEQSLAVSLLTISISSQLLQAFYKMFNQLFNNEPCWMTGLLVTVSAVLWLSKLLTPLIQASRLSSTCNELRYIGLELRARPFGYQDTPQADLDSIVIYTTNLRLKGKIVYCPIKKSFLYGLLAVTVIVILFLGQINYF